MEISIAIILSERNVEQFVFIVALLTIGMILQRAPAPADFGKSLNFFVIYVSLPATIALQVPKIEFDFSALGVMLVPWLLLPIVIAIVLWMTRHHSPQTRAALLLVMPLGNTSFVGIPIIHTLLGEEAIGYVLMYDQFGTFLILSFYGAAVIGRYESGVFHTRLILKKMLFFPPFVVLFISLLVGETPLAAQPYLQTLASTLVPLALISVGYSMRFGGEIDYSLFTQSLILKLILMPLIAFGLLVAMGTEPLALKTAVLESGMPSMITAGALAIASGFAPALSAALVGYGIIISLVTLPMILYVMERFI